MAEIDNIVVSNWSEFKVVLLKGLFDSGRFRRDRYIFRGHRSSEWELVSSFDRWFDYFGFENRIGTSELLLDIFKKELESVDLPGVCRLDDVRLTALAQHNGVPTRLLDWSASPYVAAFFAFSDAVISGNLEGRCAVWALHLNNTIWKADMGVDILDVPSIGNIRMRNQFGKFTLARTPFRCLEEFVSACRDFGIALTKFSLPASMALDAFADLEAMGITYSRVYPGLEGCALAAKARTVLSVRGEDDGCQ